MCSLVQETTTVSHAVALGVICLDSTVPLYFDSYVECDSASHQFYTGSSEYHFPSNFLVCNETASFEPVSSIIPSQQNIPNVTIRTDDQWLTLTSKDCITITPAANQIPATPAPVNVPPTQVPSASPMEDVSISPTMDPAPVLTGPREAPATNASMNNSDNSSSNGTLIGIVVGCAVVGILVATVIGYLLLRNRSSRATAEKARLSAADMSPTENQYENPHPPTDAASGVVSAPAAVPQIPALSRRMTASSDYLPDHKDQCRDVPMMPKIDKIVASTNETTGTENDGIPIVSAIGVSVTSAGPREPSGRQFVDM